MATLESLLVRITADSSGFVKNVALAENSVARMGAKMRAQGAAISAVGSKMTRGLTVPIVAVAAAAVKLSLDFSDSMTNIAALVGTSEKQLARWKVQILDMARTLPQSPKELADALYFVASAGFKGQQAMDVLKASARAAAAGLGETMTVADAVTSAVNAYGIANLKAADATDVLLATVREGKAEPEELAGVIGRVIPVAEAMGVEFHEVGGAIAGMTLSGLDAAESVTGLRGLMSSIIKPSDDARKTFKNLGLDINTFRSMVAEKGLLPSLVELRNRIGDNKDAMGKLFPNVRALTAFLNLTGRNMEKNIGISERLAKATGDTDEAFKRASESAGFRMRTALSSLQASMIQVGDIILPIVADIAEDVGKAADAFGKLPAPVQETVVKVLALTAALGPLIWIFGKLYSAGGLLVQGLGKLPQVWGLIVGAVTKVGAALSFVWEILVGLAGAFEAIAVTIGISVGALAAIVVAVVAVIAGIVYLVIKHWDTIKAYLITTWEVIRAAAIAVWNWIKDMIGKVFGPVLAMYKAAWTAITGVLLKAWNWIKETAAKIWNSEIVGEFRKTMAVWGQSITNTWNILKAYLSGVWNIIKTVAEFLFGGLLNWFKLNLAAIKLVFTAVWNVIGPYVKAVWEGMKIAATTVFNAIKTVITTAWNVIKTVSSAVWGAIGGVVKAAWGVIKATVTAAWQVVQGVVIAGLRILRGDWSGAWDAIKSKLMNAALQMGNAARNFISKVVQFFKELPGRVIAALGALGSLLVSAGKDLVMGLINGVKSMAGVLLNAAKGVVKSAVDGVKGALGIHSPSTVFFEIGKNTMQGFIRGIEQTEKALGNRLDNLGDRIRDSLAGPIKQARLETLKELKRLANNAGEQLNKAQAQFDKLKSNVEDFQGSISGGFAGFDDLSNVNRNEETGEILSIKDWADKQANAAEKFGTMLRSLADKGLNRQTIAELASAGQEGMEYAKQIMEEGQGAIQALNRLVTTIDATESKTTSALTDTYFKDNLMAVTTELQKAQAQFNLLEGNINRFSNQVDADITRFKAALDQAEAAAKRAGTSTDNLATKVGQMIGNDFPPFILSMNASAETAARNAVATHNAAKANDRLETSTQRLAMAMDRAAKTLGVQFSSIKAKDTDSKKSGKDGKSDLPPMTVVLPSVSDAPAFVKWMNDFRQGTRQ